MLITHWVVVTQLDTLFRLLNTPNLPQLMVRVVLSGEISIIATGPDPLDRVNITLGPGIDHNLLSYAVQSWFLNSPSLEKAVRNGWLTLVNNNAISGNVSSSIVPAAPTSIFIPSSITMSLDKTIRRSGYELVGGAAERLSFYSFVEFVTHASVSRSGLTLEVALWSVESSVTLLTQSFTSTSTTIASTALSVISTNLVSYEVRARLLGSIDPNVDFGYIAFAGFQASKTIPSS